MNRILVLLAAFLVSSCETFDNVPQAAMNAAQCIANAMQGDTRFNKIALAVGNFREAAVTFDYRHDGKMLRGILSTGKDFYTTDVLLPDDDSLWAALKTRCGVEREFYAV